MINTKKNRKNLYLELTKLDLITPLKRILEGRGYKLRIEDGKFVPSNMAIGWESPWVYVKPIVGARCDIYQNIFFQILKNVHSYCRSCWKIVVRPRTLVELFDLYELEREMGVPCKCGIEVRDTVHGLYGGYFYCRSKEDGQKRYQQVRELVNKHLSKDVGVFLKRYCTEYELEFGPSNELPELTDEEIQYEKYVEDHLPSIGFGTKQPDHLTARVMREWIHWAYKNGDETYKEFTGGTPLFKSYVTYHKKTGGRKNGKSK